MLEFRKRSILLLIFFIQLYIEKIYKYVAWNEETNLAAPHGTLGEMQEKKRLFSTVLASGRDSPPLFTLSTENDFVPSPPFKLLVPVLDQKMVSSRGGFILRSQTRKFLELRLKKLHCTIIARPVIISKENSTDELEEN